jgi:hypothetical protein
MGSPWATLLVLLLAPLPLGTASAQSPQSPALPTLTRVEQIRKLSVDQANQNYPSW